jgi:hypothetical protein
MAPSGPVASPIGPASGVGVGKTFVTAPAVMSSGLVPGGSGKRVRMPAGVMRSTASAMGDVTQMFPSEPAVGNSAKEPTGSGT